MYLVKSDVETTQHCVKNKYVSCDTSLNPNVKTLFCEKYIYKYNIL